MECLPPVTSTIIYQCQYIQLSPPWSSLPRPPSVNDDDYNLCTNCHITEHRRGDGSRLLKDSQYVQVCFTFTAAVYHSFIFAIFHVMHFLWQSADVIAIVKKHEVGRMTDHFWAGGEQGSGEIQDSTIHCVNRQISLIATEAKNGLASQIFAIQNVFLALGIFLKETNMLCAKCVELALCGTHSIKGHGYVLLTLIAQLYVTLCVIDYPM